jgi:hypothetical protein
MGKLYIVEGPGGSRKSETAEALRGSMSSIAPITWPEGYLMCSPYLTPQYFYSSQVLASANHILSALD